MSDTTRVIDGDEVFRAVVMNESLIQEHGGPQVMHDLGINDRELLQHASAYAEGRPETDKAVSLAFAVGVLAGLRITKLRENEQRAQAA